MKFFILLVLSISIHASADNLNVFAKFAGSYLAKKCPEHLNCEQQSSFKLVVQSENQKVTLQKFSLTGELLQQTILKEETSGDGLREARFSEGTKNANPALPFAIWNLYVVDKPNSTCEKFLPTHYSYEEIFLDDDYQAQYGSMMLYGNGVINRACGGDIADSASSLYLLIRDTR